MQRTKYTMTRMAQGLDVDAHGRNPSGGAQPQRKKTRPVLQYNLAVADNSAIE